MTAVLAAVELYLEPPAEETTLDLGPFAAAAAAVELVTMLPAIAARRIAGAAAPAAGLLKLAWTGIKHFASAAGRLMSVGFLVVTMWALGKELWTTLGVPERPTGGGRVLRFPGPHLEERS